MDWYRRGVHHDIFMVDEAANMDIKLMRVSVHVVERGQTVQISLLTVDSQMTLKQFKDHLHVNGISYSQSCFMKPYCASAFGSWHWRTGVTPDDPDAKPEFELDMSDHTKTLEQCGLTDNCRLIVPDGKED